LRPAGFEFLEHTADEGIRAFAPDLRGLLEAAARGMFAVIAEPTRVEPRVERRLEVEAASREELLHDWLERLNALHQIEGELYGEFEIELCGLRLRALVRGEPLDPERHRLRVEIKAVTWHDLAVRETGEGLEATVLFDL
jgi:SHS2 domain-containing protein